MPNNYGCVVFDKILSPHASVFKMSRNISYVRPWITVNMNHLSLVEKVCQEL